MQKKLKVSIFLTCLLLANPSLIFAGSGCIISSPTPQYSTYLALQTVIHFLTFTILGLTIGNIIGQIISRIFLGTYSIKKYSLFLFMSSATFFVSYKIFFYFDIFFFALGVSLISQILTFISYEKVSAFLLTSVGIELSRITSGILIGFPLVFIFIQTKNLFKKPFSKISIWLLLSFSSILIYYLSEISVEIHSKLFPFIGNMSSC